jgi:5'-3' exonuclease
MTTATMLIDLSSVIHPLWHIHQNDPDSNKTSIEAVRRVRALAQGVERVAICCDSGSSFRKEIDPTYKANRPVRDAALTHQIQVAIERLAEDGFPIWCVPGFEADDVIASAVKKAMIENDSTDEELDVLIVSSDKDLLQLVGPSVKAKSLTNGNLLGEEEVKAKFGVYPAQMCDFLTLVGDPTDNVKGARGIGEKRAAELLARFGSIEGLLREITEKGQTGAKITPGLFTALGEFAPRMETVRRLVELRTDVPIPWEEIHRERVPRDAQTFGEEATMTEAPIEDVPDETMEVPAMAMPEPEEGAEPASPRFSLAEPETKRPSVEIVPYERRLEPQTMMQARILAEDLFKSRMFSAYGSPHAVLSTIMVGRELGFPALASLRAFHNIEGKHAISANAMVALILKSGLAELWEPVSFGPEEATFVTKRRGARREVQLTHTLEMARQAFPKKDANWEVSWQKSGWGRNPTDNLVARATARLARMVYADVIHGLYTPEELREVAYANGAGELP